MFPCLLLACVSFIRFLFWVGIFTVISTIGIKIGFVLDLAGESDGVYIYCA